MIFGSIPIGTKIYLEDKSLKSIQDIKIGDRLLSLRLNDSDISTSNDFYIKYVKEKNKIKKKDLSFDYSTVNNIYLIKDKYSNFHYKNFMYINNPIVAKNLYDEIELGHPDDIDLYSENIQYLEYRGIKDFKTYGLLSYKSGFPDNFLSNDIKLEDETYFGNVPYFSLSLTNNYFYFTEKLCLIGIVPQILGDY